ncbi:integrin alpha-5-like [Branchiostoma floridae]|uniref:Integrin alpha-5-like n=1 Tax=Branchiostoma floridae TaxID=7739 RepID=A0A9J7LWN8_BRAFL|nr:integrin alpha-5-like [Branchiostoma floridae]
MDFLHKKMLPSTLKEYRRTFYAFVFALLLVNVHDSSCFNLDTSDATRVTRTGAAGSLFGFSVDFHGQGDSAWLLAGAPKSQTAQPGVTEGGAVFRCDVTTSISLTPNPCAPIAFDTQGDDRGVDLQGNILQKTQKSGQWFGATVKSASPAKDVVIACAPRYVYYTDTFNEREPVGNCFLAAANFTQIRNYSPCKRDSQGGFGRLGYCQAGISLDFANDAEQLLLGAVGSYFWQGQLFSKTLTYDNGVPNLGGDEKKTAEGDAWKDDFHMGYSTASGEFTGDNVPEYVVGVPRGPGSPDHLKGHVAIYDSNLAVLQAMPEKTALIGEQMGSYFGYSLVVQDVNGDGLDDIIVGAPMYSSPREHQWDLGRVYVYHLEQPGLSPVFSEPTILSGKVSSGRFGTSIAALGDINQDGFNDIAVGAPYQTGEGDNMGAVYIYHGSAEGIREEPSQEIKASDFPEPLSAFGFSVAGAKDVDNNRYPDVAIGAYEADSVVVLKSRPVVNADVTVQVEPEFIDTENKTCTLDDGTAVVCFDINICASYTGINVPDEVELKYEVTLDALKTVGQRVFFSGRETSQTWSSTLRKADPDSMCLTQKAFLRNDIRDKLSPITVAAAYSMADPVTPQPDQLLPILNMNQPSRRTRQVNILKDCGPDNICVPDLKVFVSMQGTEIVVGSDKQLLMDVVVENAGEGAYEALLSVMLPEGVDFVGTGNPRGGAIITCNLQEEDQRLLVCDLGNPFTARRTQLGLRLSTVQLTGDSNSLNFAFSVNSTNTEEAGNEGDNHITFPVPVKVNASLSVRGVSLPEQVVFMKMERENDEITHERDIGPEVTHRYEIRNVGPSDISSSKLKIQWPVHTRTGEDLLYLLAVNVTQGNGRCTVNGDVNPKGVSTESASAAQTAEALYALDSSRAARHRRAAATSDKEVAQMARPTVPSSTVRHKKKDKKRRKKKGKRHGLKKKKLVSFSPPTLTPVPQVNDLQVNDTEDCINAECIVIDCTLERLNKDNIAVVQIRSRLWVDTLLEGGFKETTLTSVADFEVLEFPYAITADVLPTARAEIVTTANPSKPSVGKRPVPLWIIILSACAGLLLLVLIILVLFKCGFFKRQTMQEYTAIKRNPPTSESPDASSGYISDKTDY